MPKGSASNRTELEKLLIWIGGHDEPSGEVYEDVRSRLMKMFYARGCRDADELADETIERVTRKVDFLIETYEGNPMYYFYGVAKNVFLEYTRRPRTEELPMHLSVEPAERRQLEIEFLDGCLGRCLKSLTEKEKSFILAYYHGDKSEKIANRRRLMKELNLSPQALRVRAFRVRAKLHRCVKRHLRGRDQ